MAQAFVVETVGHGTRQFPAGRYTRVQLGVVVDLTPAWSLQFAGNSVVAGHHALAENGLLLAVWRRF